MSLFLVLASLVPAALAGPTLAVLPFANQTGDAAYDALGKGLADMLTTDLSTVDQLTLVERSRLQALLDELALAQGDFVDPATAARLGQGLGARYVLTGALTAVAPQMRLDARVVDVESGEVVDSASAVGPTAEFFLLEKELAAGLSDELGVTLTARDQARMGRVQTESFAAFQSWATGLDALDRGQLEEARGALEAALAADARFGLAADALDDAQARLVAAGRTSQQVRSEAARAVMVGLAALRAQDATPTVAQVSALIHPRAWTPSLPGDSRDLAAVTEAVLDLGLPDDAVLDLQVTTMAVNEWALANRALAAMYLRQRPAVVTYGQELLERYPMTTWAASVRASLQSTIDELRKIEAGQAELPLLRKQARFSEAMWTCTADKRPQPRLAACEAAWTEAADLGPADPQGAVRAETGQHLVEAAVHAGQHDRARTVLAELDALAQGSTDPKLGGFVNRARTVVERLDINLADIDKRRAGLADARDGGRHAMLASRLAAVGQHTEAQAIVDQGLALFPADPKLLETATELALDVHDADRAAAAFAAWEAVVQPLNSRVASSYRRLDQDLADARRGRARALTDLARDLASRALYSETGDTWLRIAREEAAHSQTPEDALLSQAAFNLGQAGRIDEARALYQEVLDRFPASSSAEAARVHLGTLPE